MIIVSVLKEFVKDPIKVTLFLSLCVIGYLYIDNKMVYIEQIKKQDERILVLEKNYQELQDRMITMITKQ